MHEFRMNIQTFIGCESDYASASIVLFGAPFDSTTSNRPGARFGPKAIRSESFGIETYSPHQDKDLTDISVYDAGDLELSFGEPAKAIDSIEALVSRVAADGKLPLMLGGEHLVTLGAVRALHRLHPDLCIMHFDAHADLRDDYLGAKLSHACVLRRCWELVGDGKIHQFGIRSGDREEFRWAEQGHVNMIKFGISGLEAALKEVADRPVYLTVDLDVLDPAEFPGTGTPEAGGVSFTNLLNAIRCICDNVRIVGCDLVELSPTYDPSGISTALACKLTRETLLAL